MKNVVGWMVPDFDRVIAKQCRSFPETYYQQDILDWALSNVKSFNLAVDVGANIGLHSVRFAQKFSQVESFEPFSTNYECLEKNVSTFVNVKLHKKALGSINKTEMISLPKDLDNSGAVSFIDFQNSEKELIHESVEIKTLDDYDLSPNLIKIDTQSYELEVLRGARNTLEKHKPVLIIEVGKGKPLQDIQEYLNQFGYVMDGITNKDKGFRVIL
jgi:FkbM family methyltransferase